MEIKPSKIITWPLGLAFKGAVWIVSIPFKVVGGVAKAIIYPLILVGMGAGAYIYWDEVKQGGHYIAEGYRRTSACYRIAAAGGEKSENEKPTYEENNYGNAGLVKRLGGCYDAFVEGEYSGKAGGLESKTEAKAEEKSEAAKKAEEKAYELKKNAEEAAKKTGEEIKKVEEGVKALDKVSNYWDKTTKFWNDYPAEAWKRGNKCYDIASAENNRGIWEETKSCYNTVTRSSAKKKAKK